MSNYPPGVTGNEYEIAGPDYEDYTDRSCWHCSNTAGNLQQGYGKEHWVICGGCYLRTDLEQEYDDGADDAYDRMKDREYD